MGEYRLARVQRHAGERCMNAGYEGQVSGLPGAETPVLQFSTKEISARCPILFTDSGIQCHE